jgi:exodeoxyribonuclease-5
VNITLRFLDLNVEMEGKIILDSLHTDAPSLLKEQQNELFNSVLADYDENLSRSARMRKLKEDPYFNAFQAKYAYSTTCHKAQGGQWKNVILDVGNLRTEYLGSDFYRWLYTSLTRATERLFLLNMPKEMSEE